MLRHSLVLARPHLGTILRFFRAANHDCVSYLVGETFYSSRAVPISHEVIELCDCSSRLLSSDANFTLDYRPQLAKLEYGFTQDCTSLCICENLFPGRPAST